MTRAPRWPSRRRLLAFIVRTAGDFLELVEWPDEDDSDAKPRAPGVRPPAQPDRPPSELETARARSMLRRRGIHS